MPDGLARGNLRPISHAIAQACFFIALALNNMDKN
jgi:hypothetical protein